MTGVKRTVKACHRQEQLNRPPSAKVRRLSPGVVAFCMSKRPFQCTKKRCNGTRATPTRAPITPFGSPMTTLKFWKQNTVQKFFRIFLSREQLATMRLCGCTYINKYRVERQMSYTMSRGCFQLSPLPIRMLPRSDEKFKKFLVFSEDLVNKPCCTPALQ